MPGSETPPVVLGSQSKQRRELIGSLLGNRPWSVVAPRDATEAEFADGLTLPEIDEQLLCIARQKHADVSSQIVDWLPTPLVLTADTIIVALPAGRPAVVLGKPPEEESQCDSTVRRWFSEYYAGRRHLAKTGLCIGPAGQPPVETVVTTEVWFRADAGELVDWYLGTGEPRGKAGGYAIQQLGSLFVERLSGSLSNVVGLPLMETLTLIQSAAGNST
ncbi:MAG: Maf family protein [Planctomycetaceae bacterium]